MPQSTDTTRVRLLNQLAYVLRATSTAEAADYAQQAIDYSRELKFLKGEALGLFRLGITQGFQYNWDKTLATLEESRTLAVRIGEWNIAAETSLNIGGIYQTRSNTKKAFENLVSSMSFYEKAGNRKGVASALYGIGNTYTKEKKYDLALENYQKSQALFEELGEVREIPKVLVNVGTLYHEQANDTEALNYFTQAIDGFRESKNQRGTATALLYRADTYFALNEWNNAINDLNASMVLNNQTNHEFNKVKCHVLYGKIFRAQGKLDEARKQLEESLVISKKVKLTQETSDAYRLLAEISSDQGDYKNAYYFHQQHRVYNDSIFNKEKSRQIQELQIAYETEKKEAEIRDLKNQQILNRTYQYGSFIFLALVLLVAFLILNRQRLKIKKDKELAEKEAQILEERKALLDAELLNRQLTEERLQKELDYKNKELTTYALNLIQKNEVLENIKSAVDEIRSSLETDVRSKLTSLINTVNYSFHLDKDWENFKVHFEQVHQSFFDKLLQMYPDLNANDMKLCALIKLNLDTKETASILDISPESAKVARHRLRKKLNLTQDQNLAAFLASI